MRKCKKEYLAQWMSLSLKKTFTPSNVNARFKFCEIWPLNPKAMTKRIEPLRSYKPIDVEVEEIVDEILEEGGIPTVKLETPNSLFLKRIVRRILKNQVRNYFLHI